MIEKELVVQIESAKSLEETMEIIADVILCADPNNIYAEIEEICSKFLEGEIGNVELPDKLNYILHEKCFHSEDYYLFGKAIATVFDPNPEMDEDLKV